MMATPVSSFGSRQVEHVWPGLGLKTCRQVVPFQCMVVVLVPPPTAHALRGDASFTPAAPAGPGAGTWDQLAPFQCSMSVARAFFVKPIAHASDADAALTAKSLVSPPEPETGTR